MEHPKFPDSHPGCIAYLYLLSLLPWWAASPLREVTESCVHAQHLVGNQAHI